MQKKRILILALAVGIVIFIRQLNDKKLPVLHELKGTTMGEIAYNIKYVAHSDLYLQEEVDSILVAFNQSLSTYIPTSEISKFNRFDQSENPSTLLYTIMEVSNQIYKKSKGAYDPTIGLLVNAWGFGPTQKVQLDSTQVDALLLKVGFNQVTFNQKKISKPKGMYLDFSASAKGYALDVIADYFVTHAISHYMIEIGGEVRCKGKNHQSNRWKIGIERPVLAQQRGSLYATVFVTDRALATSGNYRNYYMKGNQIIAHTISPVTGYSVSHRLLSVSIFAHTCVIADGYATACMVMGLEESIEMVEAIDQLEALLIYSNPDGTLSHYITEGIQSQIEILK